MQSLFYGFTSVLLVIAVAALCTGVKKVMKKITIKNKMEIAAAYPIL